MAYLCYRAWSFGCEFFSVIVKLETYILVSLELMNVMEIRCLFHFHCQRRFCVSMTLHFKQRATVSSAFLWFCVNLLKRASLSFKNITLVGFSFQMTSCFKQ
jgi:capsule polysaccharide modification protein KpsS